MAAFSLCPRRTLPPKVGGQTSFRAVNSSSLRVRSCSRASRTVRSDSASDGDLVQSLAQRRLHLVRALLERPERIVALALEPGAQSGEAILDALRGVVADVVQPLGEHSLGLAREALDGQIELAAQPARGRLARGADRRVELLRRGLGVARRLARDKPLQLLDLPSLDVAERELDPLRRVVALALDDLLQVALALAQPLGDVLQRASPFRRVLLELGRRLLRHVLRGRSRAPCAAGRSAAAVRRSAACRPSASWPIRDSISVISCRCFDLEALQLVGEPFLELRDVGVPVAEALLDRALHRDELLAELRARVALALGDVAAPLLGDSPLLVGEQRERVGPRARQDVRQLLGALARAPAATTRRTRPCRGRPRARAGVAARAPCVARRSRPSSAATATSGRHDGSDGREESRRHVGARPRGRRRAPPSPSARSRSERSSGSIPSVVACSRRARRTGVESVRWTRIVAVANAAAATASSRSVCASTK